MHRERVYMSPPFLPLIQKYIRSFVSTHKMNDQCCNKKILLGECIRNTHTWVLDPGTCIYFRVHKLV